MSEINEEMAVNEVIRFFPETVAVFNDFAIDACCGGSDSVRDAAIRDGADPDELMAALRQALAGAA